MHSIRTYGIRALPAMIMIHIFLLSGITGFSCPPQKIHNNIFKVAEPLVNTHTISSALNQPDTKQIRRNQVNELSENELKSTEINFTGWPGKSYQHKQRFIAPLIIEASVRTGTGIFIALVLMVILLLYLSVRLYFHKFNSKASNLADAEQKYKTLFNAANDGIFLLEKYRFIECNPKALEIFGTTKEDLLGSTIDQFSPEKQPDGSSSYDKAINIIDKTLKGERQFFEWLHKKKSGEVFYAEVSVNKLELKKREILLAIVRDVTSRKSLEKRMIEAKNRAEESDRLKSAFLANTSHEIRTPMNAIVGFSKLLQRGKSSSEKQAEYTENIIEKGSQLLRIINDILDVSKIEANQLVLNQTRFSLNRLMDDIYQGFEPIAAQKPQIRFYMHKEVKNDNFVFMDKNRLRQIMNNLLSNAFKYTEAGKVEAGYKLQDKDHILFYIKDTGIGIDQGKQHIIFDRFRKDEDTNTRLYGGTGLGLSISKALVELMDGEIWVESELNQGAAFYFRLPYIPAYKTKEELTLQPESSYDWKGKTILIVEDDSLSYDYLKELLKETKADIMHAKDGLAAIQQSRENQEIDLVLMDIHLPGIDGNTATLKIREFNKNLPIIAQTAYAMEEEKNKILQAGCNDYVSKPINEFELHRKIDQYLPKD